MPSTFKIGFGQPSFPHSCHKGQIKPKAVWDRCRFSQKMNKQIRFVRREKQKSKQNKFIHSFFGESRVRQSTLGFIWPLVGYVNMYVKIFENRFQTCSRGSFEYAMTWIPIFIGDLYWRIFANTYLLKLCRYIPRYLIFFGRNVEDYIGI